MVVVDGANVVGSRPTGWWRDRAGAARDLADRLRTAVAEGTLDPPVVLVLEGAARRGVDEGDAGGVRVVHAPGLGDDTIAAAARAAAAGGEPTILVSADRGLAQRVHDLGVQVVGPHWLLGRLSSGDRAGARDDQHEPQ
ncbi:MAG: hypothetical protein QOJ62_2140 [Actinomycetota bacterium]|nr:hypothetical protein [Actinomycetota bacterium]